MKSYWFQRGPASPEVPREFFWEGIDGSRLQAFWLARGYSRVHDAPTSPADFSRFIRVAFDQTTPWIRGRERVLMAGAGVWEPEWCLPQMMDQFNRTPAAPFKLQFALPSHYEAIRGEAAQTRLLSKAISILYSSEFTAAVLK